jgi:hypothetical protein
MKTGLAFLRALPVELDEMTGLEAKETFIQRVCRLFNKMTHAGLATAPIHGAHLWNCSNCPVSTGFPQAGNDSWVRFG